MKDIIIKSEDKSFIVEQGDKKAVKVGWEEMMWLVASLTIPDEKPCLQWMKENRDEYMPKDGDFIVRYEKDILICKSPQKDEDGGIMFNHYLSYNIETKKINKEPSVGYYEQKNVRPARYEEIRLLLEKMHEFGHDWDDVNKVVVYYNNPYKPNDGDFVHILQNNGTENIVVYNEEEERSWQPKVGERFYHPYFNQVRGNYEPASDKWSGEYHCSQNSCHTLEDCQAKCYDLNRSLRLFIRLWNTSLF